MCLQAMAIVYGKCHEEIGGFNDTKYIVGMLDRVRDLYNCVFSMCLTMGCQFLES